MNAPTEKQSLARNVKSISHLDLPGAGQVYVDGKHAYVGHITNKEGLGTSILDVSDPKKPKVLAQIPVGDANSHSHKARVIGDVMIVNMEQNMTGIGRKADELPKLRTALREELGRDPTNAELAAKLGVKESDIPAVTAAEKSPYDQGGFKIYDVSDRTKPKLIKRLTGAAFTASTWTPTTRTSRPRCLVTWATSWLPTTFVIRPGPKKSRAGGCRGSTRPVARNRRGRAASIACTTH